MFVERTLAQSVSASPIADISIVTFTQDQWGGWWMKELWSDGKIGMRSECALSEQACQYIEAAAALNGHKCEWRRHSAAKAKEAAA